MFFRSKIRAAALCFMVALAAGGATAYTGSEAFLHYYAAPATVLSQYQSVCKSILVSDTLHDTLLHAVAELDSAMPKILGGNKLPRGDGAGAIVIAEQGSPLVSSAGIDYSTVNAEGFIIKTVGGKTYITGKSQVGVLRGTFRFLRLMQTQKNITSLNIVENPYFKYRVLDHWYNHYLTTGDDAERLYGGKKAFLMQDFGSLSGAELQRVLVYCRMGAALGINGMCPDNVNTYRSGGLGNYKCLEASNLKNEKVFADMIGTWGLKYYLSVSYASPKLVSPKISTCDAYKDSTARKWWFDKVDTVHAYIKNFGGFLLKADSEGEDGPRSTYGETQSQGANPIALALKRYGYILIWRTFIYDTSDPDFAVNQSKEFANQTWDSAIVLRCKDGPRDFQMIEPPNQIMAMSGVRHGMEMQITQEYLGQAIHVCWEVPRWKKVLDWNLPGASTWNGAPGTITHQLLKGGSDATAGGLWGIGNLSDTVNWTGHFLHQANYYGWGRLTWNPYTSADTIADEWIRCSVDNGYNPGVQYVIRNVLQNSWQAYTEYTIGHGALMPALMNNNHYPVDFSGMSKSSFFTKYFMDFLSNGIGVNRSNIASETGDVKNDFAHTYLPSAVADSFADTNRCPEDYLLFFHHMGWTHPMKSGMSLIQQLEFEHFRGIHQVQKFIKYWTLCKSATTLDDAIYSHVLSKFNKQLTDGSVWADTFRVQFGRYYSTQVPCHLDIITPDTTKATAANPGVGVNLSALLRTQNGTAVNNETFKWTCSGGSLSTTTGASTVFTANAAGVYTVTLADAQWPTMTEEVQVFVGDWTNSGITGTHAEAVKVAPMSLRIMQGAHRVAITSPFAGKISITSLQGRTIKSLAAGKASPVYWDTRGVAKGLYMVKVHGDAQTLQGKILVQ